MFSRIFDKLNNVTTIILLGILTFILTSCKHSVSGDDGRTDPPLETINTIDTEPNWSNDGLKIVYTHYPQNAEEMKNGSCQIWVFSLKDSSKQFIAPGLSPKWSPDGNKLAYFIPGQIIIFDTRYNKSSILVSWEDAYCPSWSPDGNYVVFYSGNGDSRGAYSIWKYNLQNDSYIDIGQHGTGSWEQPTWSPDGSKILFSRYLSGDNQTSELCTMDSTGNNLQRITTNSYNDRYVSWSRDGKKIAWNSGYKDNEGIWLMNSDGTDANLLIKAGGFPTWSPDGSELIYYTTDSVKKIGYLKRYNLISKLSSNLF